MSDVWEELNQPGVSEEQAQGLSVVALNLFQAFQAFLQAGFNEDQAMQIVLKGLEQ